MKTNKNYSWSPLYPLCINKIQKKNYQAKKIKSTLSKFYQKVQEEREEWRFGA